MPTTIELLDPAETEQALTGHRFGSSETLAKISESLMTVLDTDASVFVSGLNESNINALRTKMARRNVRVVVRKVSGGARETGHVLLAKSMA